MHRWYYKFHFLLSPMVCYFNLVGADTVNDQKQIRLFVKKMKKIIYNLSRTDPNERAN